MAYGRTGTAGTAPEATRRDGEGPVHWWEAVWARGHRLLLGRTWAGTPLAVLLRPSGRSFISAVTQDGRDRGRRGGRELIHSPALEKLRPACVKMAHGQTQDPGVTGERVRGKDNGGCTWCVGWCVGWVHPASQSPWEPIPPASSGARPNGGQKSPLEIASFD